MFIYASEEANPLLYYVHVCPHCGFAATEEFSTETDDFIYTHMSEVRLLYLIGELYRRLGKEKQAIIYFSRVIARKKETIEKGIVNMAYDRWQEIREEKKGHNSPLKHGIFLNICINSFDKLIRILCCDNIPIYHRKQRIGTFPTIP